MKGTWLARLISISSRLGNLLRLAGKFEMHKIAMSTAHDCKRNCLTFRLNRRKKQTCASGEKLIGVQCYKPP